MGLLVFGWRRYGGVWHCVADYHNQTSMRPNGN